MDDYDDYDYEHPVGDYKNVYSDDYGDVVSWWYEHDDIQKGIPYKTLENGMKSLEHFSRTMKGINFALLMETKDEKGDTMYRVYPRPNQPCQGGEMRKYGKRSTRPNDPRPGDLRCPFPDGVLIAVGIHLFFRPTIKTIDGKAIPIYNETNSYVIDYEKLSLEESVNLHNQFVNAVYGPDSMYMKALKCSEDSIKRLYDKNNCIEGLLFTDTNVDPTVLVNSLQFLRSYINNTNYFQTLLEMGFNTQEALIIRMLSGSIIMFDVINNSIYVTPTNSYYFSSSASLNRLFDGDPNDLSGGSYRDGYDYNRPNVQDLFKETGSDKPLNWFNEFNSRYKSKYGKSPTKQVNPYEKVSVVTKEEFVEINREIFNDLYYNQQEKAE